MAIAGRSTSFCRRANVTMVCTLSGATWALSTGTRGGWVRRSALSEGTDPSGATLLYTWADYVSKYNVPPLVFHSVVWPECSPYFDDACAQNPGDSISKYPQVSAVRYPCLLADQWHPSCHHKRPSSTHISCALANVVYGKADGSILTTRRRRF
jgi:hypothetical protein